MQKNDSFTTMKQKPLILVTNDDGINAKGILHLSTIAMQFGDVCVIAPDKPQSGMGHAITINATLRLQKTQYHKGAFMEYSCTGTPVDCVKMAVNKLLPRKPDLVLSGINHGSNSSINVIYSGTMSAAIEGSLEGTSSIGFSLNDHNFDADFNGTTTFIEKIITSVLNDTLPNGVCLNVNFPKLTSDEIKGLKVCRQAKANWVEDFEERHDPHGMPYYWLTGKFVNFEPEAEDTDEWALKNGFATIVPTLHDLTAHNYINHLKNML
jgi:5'-nucleotidase